MSQNRTSVDELRAVARGAREVVRDAPAVIRNGLRLRHDPLFALAHARDGLRERPASSPPGSRRAIATRILAAYRKAVMDQARESSHYRPSNEWLPIYRRPLRPLVAALESGDPDELVALMDDFFRSAASLGLCGLPTDMSATYFGRVPSRFRQLQYLVDALHRWRLLQRLVPGVTAADLHIPDAGNPYGMTIDGSFVRTGADYQYFYARRVAELVADAAEPAPVVVELGGGVGGFAHFLAHQLPRGATYVDLDLPEILAIAEYLLMTALPDATFVLYGEGEPAPDPAAPLPRMVMLPSFAIEAMSPGSATVSFNSYSLAEMDPAAIQNYATQLGRITRYAIYHVNHVRRARLGADSFDFGDGFTLAERRRAEWNLARNLKCDEYEFLLLRHNGDR